VCISLCTTVVHNTAQNSSDNLPSYPPGNHHCSDAVYYGINRKAVLIGSLVSEWYRPITVLCRMISMINHAYSPITPPSTSTAKLQAVVCGVTAFCDRFCTFPRAVTIINCPMCSACSAIFYGNNFIDKDDRDYLANERIRTRRGVNIQFFYPEYSLHLHGFAGVQQ